jgi:hypothetical protein
MKDSNGKNLNINLKGNTNVCQEDNTIKINIPDIKVDPCAEGDEPVTELTWKLEFSITVVKNNENDATYNLGACEVRQEVAKIDVPECCSDGCKRCFSGPKTEITIYDQKTGEDGCLETAQVYYKSTIQLKCNTQAFFDGKPMTKDVDIIIDKQPEPGSVMTCEEIKALGEPREVTIPIGSPSSPTATCKFVYRYDVGSLNCCSTTPEATTTCEPCDESAKESEETPGGGGSSRSRGEEDTTSPPGEEEEDAQGVTGGVGTVTTPCPDCEGVVGEAYQGANDPRGSDPQTDYVNTALVKKGTKPKGKPDPSDTPPNNIITSTQTPTIIDPESITTTAAPIITTAAPIITTAAPIITTAAPTLPP